MMFLVAVVRAGSYNFTTIDVPYAGAFQTSPIGIGENGEIVGYYLTFGLRSHGFLLRRGQFSTYDFTSANCCSDFHAVNNHGQVVGFGGNAGFLFSGGGFSSISFPGSTLTNPEGINNSGTIVGRTIVSNTVTGFILNKDGFSLIANSTAASGINDAGQIVGISGTHGFLLSQAGFSLIDYPGALGTYLQGINNKTQIAGWYVATPTLLHGFILDDQGFHVIDFPGASSTQIFGINDKGEIVGTYYDHSGTHGFLATPEPPR